MNVVGVLVASVLGILGVFALLNWLSRVRDKTTPADVRRTIEGFLADTLKPWDWDDFLCSPLKNPRLDAIARHCGRLPDEYPPQAPGAFCGPGGLEVLRGYVEELRRVEAEQQRERVP
jgi:hypothetical protein